MPPRNSRVFFCLLPTRVRYAPLQFSLREGSSTIFHRRLASNCGHPRYFLYVRFASAVGLSGNKKRHVLVGEPNPAASTLTIIILLLCVGKVNAFV